MDHTFQGVFFSEDRPNGIEELKEISVTLDDQWFGGSQLKCLDDVKSLMARMVKASGGDALVGFTYGQKSVGFWKSLLSIDDVSWWGKGVAAKRRPMKR